MDDSVLRIGRVVEVDGARAIGELETTVDDLYRTYRSRRYSIGQIGSIVKIVSGDTLIFGVVTSLRMAEVEVRANDQARRGESLNTKSIEIQLFGQGDRTGLGETDFSFERGISSYPLPGQPICLTTIGELRKVYQEPDKSSVRIGMLAQAAGLPVHLLTDELLGKHFALLGATGSGKSCSLALILQAILDECPNAHIILLDPHNEYSSAFPGNSVRIDPTTLEIPHWLLNFEESIELFVGRTEYAATSQTNILKEALLKARRKFANGGNGEKRITVDTPIPYRLSDLVSAIDATMPPQESKRESYQKILNKIATLSEDDRFEFLVRPDDKVQDNLAELLSNMLRIPTNGCPLSIIDLSGVPSDVVDVVVSVLCRTIFDFTLWNKQRREMPLLLVCEEAHRYAPSTESAAFQPTRRALSRIAKEGRKYGVGLALVTQRPSELSENILSQCNTIIALRMANDQDQQFVRRALPDSVKSLVDVLPALRTREAIVVGEAATVLFRVLFNKIDENKRPRSQNVPFSKSWKDCPGSEDAVKDAIRRWREQDRS